MKKKRGYRRNLTLAKGAFKKYRPQQKQSADAVPANNDVQADGAIFPNAWGSPAQNPVTIEPILPTSPLLSTVKRHQGDVSLGSPGQSHVPVQPLLPNSPLQSTVRTYQKDVLNFPGRCSPGSPACNDMPVEPLLKTVPPDSSSRPTPSIRVAS